MSTATGILKGGRRPRPDLLVLARAETRGTPVPPPGFAGSDFAGLAAAAADDCLTQVHRSAPAPAHRGRDTAVVLVSRSGDRAVVRAVDEALAAGRRVSPLLFFQSVPNSVAGWIAGRWGLQGPVTCVSPTGTAADDGTALARLLIEDEEAAEVLLVLVETADQGGEACALLLTRPSTPPTQGGAR